VQLTLNYHRVDNHSYVIDAQAVIERIRPASRVRKNTAMAVSNVSFKRDIRPSDGVEEVKQDA
jgi:hypothetical protein|tara:strand:+ start:65 stop:253 length:189 start_codon:yes stop_codon:yes gene_type:complete